MDTWVAVSVGEAGGVVAALWRERQALGLGAAVRRGVGDAVGEAVGEAYGEAAGVVNCSVSTGAGSAKRTRFLGGGEGSSSTSAGAYV